MTTPTLQAWMDEHGPLGPHEAALVAIACVSRLMQPSAGRAGASVRQVDPAHVERAADGQWTWSPERAVRSNAAVSEREAVVAVGRLMYAVLTGTPAGARVFVPVDLRKVRPDVPAPMAVLVADALNGETSLDQLCAGLQAVAGIRAKRTRLPASFAWALSVVMAVGVLVAAVGRSPAASTARLDPYTGIDQDLEDSLWDASFGLAWMDEQTAAIDYVEALAQLESRRAGYDSARAWWRLAWLAWLSQQRNDYLTAEQYGATSQERLAVLLGPGHPYTLSTSALQAATLRHRGAWDAARAQVSTMWQAQLARLRVSGSRVAREPSDGDVRQWDPDRDADGDGLADLVERMLGTDANVAAGPTEQVDGRPARAYALALNPGMVAAHVRDTAPWDEGFSARRRTSGTVTPVYVLASVQRGYAERFGWILQVDANEGGCAIALDTGTSPRRLQVELERRDDGWDVSAGGTTQHVAAEGGPLSVTADFDAPSRTIYWWTSAGSTWQTSFDALASSGDGPYGLWLLGDSANTCDSVTWTLRRAEIAPL